MNTIAAELLRRDCTLVTKPVEYTGDRHVGAGIRLYCRAEIPERAALCIVTELILVNIQSAVFNPSISAVKSPRVYTDRWVFAT